MEQLQGQIHNNIRQLQEHLRQTQEDIKQINDLRQPAVSIADDILKAGQNVKGNQDLDCAIFQEPTLGEKEVLKIRCAHLFHRACLKEWFMSSPTCPLCREDLSEDPGD